MIRFASFVAGLMLLASTAQSQDNIKLQVTIRVPASIDSFQNQRLITLLAKQDTSGEGRDLVVDRQMDEKLSHTKGKDTIIKVALGNKDKFTPGVNHKLIVHVMTPTGKRTLIGEREGSAGPIFVQSGNLPKNLLVVLRAEK